MAQESQEPPRPPATVAPLPLMDSYTSQESAYDELLLSPKTPRPHWGRLVQLLERLTRDDWNARSENARRILREHGATYNVYSDNQGLERPWALDLVPLLVPPAEWRVIEAGLTQRAKLLNTILSDIYGPQRLIQEGWLPHTLIQANPSFLRACHGIQPAHGVHLFLHAVDLARSPDGQWWVLADRTQAPSGAGYTLENRMVLSRVHTAEFRDCQVQRMAEFFHEARNMLRLLAPHEREQPHIVLLTPGPYNETYFEQVFLARYLGFPLVEGGDLTVRDRCVYIKTLEGLQRVDVIIRRVDDTFCDPLELRSDSFLGVAGLTEAARAGNVTLANALGSGAVEGPALSAFLPNLCRKILNQDLILPSVATWWCGQERERQYVAEHLEELVIKSSFAPQSRPPVFGSKLSSKQKSRLLQEIKERPSEFVGQEQVALGTAPVYSQGKLESRHIVLRAFLCATTDGYIVLPGGLTRFSSSREDLVVSMQSGGGSKDTWVMGDSPHNLVTVPRSPMQGVHLERAASEIPSRVADNIYWLGRYAERMEDTARLLRCVLSQLTQESAREATPELTSLIHLLVRLDLFPSTFLRPHSLHMVEREVYQLIYQVHRLGTVREVLGRLKNIAFVLRDRFSADTWRIINKLQSEMKPRPGRVPAAEALGFLNTVIVDLAAFSGVEMENMTRGHAWRFLDLGRRLERATNMVTLMKAGLAVETDTLSALDSILDIADSQLTHRRRYFAQATWPTVAEVLLADDSNPRSLAFQLTAIADHAPKLPGAFDKNGSLIGAALAMAGLKDSLDPAVVPAMAAATAHTSGEKLPLEEWLDEILNQLLQISDQLTHQYFSHALARVS